MKKYGCLEILKKQQTIISETSRKLADKVDTKIYRIISGEYKLRKDGELDQRFKENKGKK